MTVWSKSSKARMKPTWRKSSSCWINTLRSQPSPSDAVAAVENPTLVPFALPRTWRSSSLRPRSSPRNTTTTLSKWLWMLFPALLRSCPKFKKSLSPRPAWNYLPHFPFVFPLTCLVFEKFWSFFKFTSLSHTKQTCLSLLVMLFFLPEITLAKIINIPGSFLVIVLVFYLNQSRVYMCDEIISAVPLQWLSYLWVDLMEWWNTKYSEEIYCLLIFFFSTKFLFFISYATIEHFF